MTNERLQEMAEKFSADTCLNIYQCSILIKLLSQVDEEARKEGFNKGAQSQYGPSVMASLDKAKQEGWNEAIEAVAISLESSCSHDEACGENYCSHAIQIRQLKKQARKKNSGL